MVGEQPEPQRRPTSERPATGESPATSDGERLTYEQARDELADVVTRLEAGGVTLEESLALWERGEELAQICEQWLQGVRARLAHAMDAAHDSESTTAGDQETR